MADTSTTTYVRQLADYLEGHYAKQKAMIRLMRQLRSLTHEVQIPDEYKSTTRAVRTPILADMIQRVVAQLTVQYPYWERGRMGGGPTDEKDSSLIEKWLLAAHTKMERQQQRNIWESIMDSAISDGMGCCQYRYLPGNWTPFPRRTKDERGEYEEEADPYLARVSKHTKTRPFPFAWEQIDPLCYYRWDAYDGRREYVLIQDVPLAPTARALGVYRADKEWRQGEPGQALPADGISSGDTVRLIQHWTDETVTFLLDGQLASQQEHKMGMSGFYDFAGLSTSERAPERAYLPVAYAFAELVPFLDRLLTMKANWMYLSTFPRGVLKLSQARLDAMYAALPDGERARAGAVSGQLGQLNALITLVEGEEFGWASPPPVGADLNQLISLVAGMIDQSGLGSVLRGQLPSGGADMSGYLYNQMSVLGRIAYEPVTNHAKFMLRGGAEFLLRGVDRLVSGGSKADIAVPVWGKTPMETNKDLKGWLLLSKKHINGIYDTEPKLEPLLPSNLIMEGQFGAGLAEKFHISERQFRSEYLKQQHPEETEHEIRLEKAKRLVEDQMIQEAGMEAGILPKPEPAPSGLVGLNGSPLPSSIGGQGMPVQPGLGMPMQPEPPRGAPVQAMIPGPQAPGAAPANQPGGNLIPVQGA